MSFHFLLDGYNIIKQTSSLNQGTLEGQRLALIKWIKIHQLSKRAGHTITVVFDGQSDFYGSLGDSDIKVIFSSGESADDVIKRIVENDPKRSWVVVSNDKGITLYVRALGASILSVQEFFARIQQKSKASKSGGPKTQMVSQKDISLTQQAKITKELQKIWIKPTP